MIPEGCMEIGYRDTGSNGTYERRSALLEPPCNRHHPKTALTNKTFHHLIRTDCTVESPCWRLFLCYENTSFVLLLTFKCTSKKSHAVPRWLSIKSSDPNTQCIFLLRLKHAYTVGPTVNMEGKAVFVATGALF